MRFALAVIHLLALGIGLGAIWMRARALGGPLDRPGVKRALGADVAWGIAAFLWISTGLWRWIGGVEKPFEYYLQNHLFLAKMLFLIVILLLEFAPMRALMRWRLALGSGRAIDTSRARSYAATSVIQIVLVVFMVVCAAGMARGYGFPHE